MIEEITIFFQIVLIDLVLAGDNAIIIGLVASQFDQNLRKKIIFWGIGAAIILRIVFTLITAYLLQIDGLKLVGGLLLLYISYKLYRDVIKNEIAEEKKIESGNLTFYKAILIIIIKSAPASAKAMAQAFPIPLLAPVTNAVLFFKLIFLRCIFILIFLSQYKLILMLLLV